MSVSELEEKLLVSPLHWQDRLVLYLVHQGRKPACTLFKKVKAGEDQAYLERVRDVIDPLPLSISSCSMGDEIYLDIYVGCDQEHLDLFLAAEKLRKEANRAMGIALGFPSDAIEAFVRHSSFPDISEYPQQLRELKRFLFFSPSQDNWQESIDYVTSIRDFVRETAPALYGHIQGGSDRK